MKECGIENRVYGLELNLTESEQMTCGILDQILGEDITDMIIGVIDAAYEAGQDAAVEAIRENCEEYMDSESVKERLVSSKLFYTDDPYFEREFRTAISKQELVRGSMKEIFGEDADFCRIRDKVYLEIGRVTRW